MKDVNKNLDNELNDFRDEITKLEIEIKNKISLLNIMNNNTKKEI